MILLFNLCQNPHIKLKYLNNKIVIYGIQKEIINIGRKRKETEIKFKVNFKEIFRATTIGKTPLNT
jgi:hypothetical protein